MSENESFALGTCLATQRWCRLGGRCSYCGCRYRLICVVNVHDDVFRVIGEIGYISDNIGDNI